MGRTLIKIREEFVYIFSGFFSLVCGVRDVFILNSGDQGGFSFCLWEERWYEVFLSLLFVKKEILSAFVSSTSKFCRLICLAFR